MTTEFELLKKNADLATQWRGADNQQEFCDVWLTDLLGVDRQHPDYWTLLDELEDAWLELIEGDEQPVPNPVLH